MEEEIRDSSTIPDYEAEIEEIIKSQLSPRIMRDRLLEYHSNDIASALGDLPTAERSKLYSILDDDSLADILEYTEQPDIYLNELSIAKRTAILSRLEPAVSVEYLDSLDTDGRKALLELLPVESRTEITLLSSFHKDEIGSKMTTDYVSVNSDCNVRRAMSLLVAQAAENDNVSTIYVVDEDETFVGAIALPDLIRARADTPLENIIMYSYPYVYSDELVEDCLERVRGYSEDTVPVLNRQNKLTGVLTAQDLMEVVEDEIGEDYAKLGGLSSEEELSEPLFKSIGKRLPWLVILFGLGLLVSSVVGLFESVVARLTIIVSFQSLILGMAGNVGTQSLAVTIRALTDEELSGKDRAFLIFKEARIGLLNGLILGSLSFLLIGSYLHLRGETAPLAFSVSLCTGLALLVSMLLSSISGTAIPIAFKKMKVDPAVASGPFITTINDLVAVITYYGLAWLLLSQIVI